MKKGVERMKELGLKPAPWVEEMLAAGRERFYGVDGRRDTYWDIRRRSRRSRCRRTPRTSRVEYLKRGNKKIAENDSATLWDMGDGVALLEFHSKMNSIDDDIIAMMNKALDEAEKNFRGLVIGNDGANFSAGANIMALLMAIKSDDFDAVREDGRRLPGGQPAHALQPDPGGDGARSASPWAAAPR